MKSKMTREQCKMPNCSNDLPPGRTYECPECTSKIIDWFRYFSRPLSSILPKDDSSS
ncbi:hypothetical protein [Aerosakkonema sp. BLCC-F183]|uniref:hypothetical protein n=1 Tax=Aerosakkonema sp. BLCC-F183 TaxID=3342834 RepID=UPI0035BC1E46